MENIVVVAASIMLPVMLVGSIVYFLASRKRGVEQGRQIEDCQLEMLTKKQSPQLKLLHSIAILAVVVLYLFGAKIGITFATELAGVFVVVYVSILIYLSRRKSE